MIRGCWTGTSRLLVCRDDTGWCELRSAEVNERFKELAGEEFTVKDLRTWHATVLAALALADDEPPASQRGRQRAVAGAMREVAEELGNTAAVARCSYVDPRVLRAYERGRTVRPELSDGGTELQAIEQAVLRLLREPNG